MTMTTMKLTGRKPFILLVHLLIFCALPTMPAGASASGRLDPALCPMRAAASEYTNARSIPTPAFHAHSLPTDAGRGHTEQAQIGHEHAEQTHSEQAHAQQTHSEQANPEQAHVQQAHSGQEHAAPLHAGQEQAGGGESGHTRHDAFPAQENDCRCDPYSMSRCFPFTPPVLLSSGEACIRPVQRALHEPRNETPVKSLHADNLFRPPRIPAA
jgi:hypothetical protein